ncbi:uncharacterized protein BDZ99DRAFT_565381 [Mytilinidion resinicola]|uniref:Tachykinin family protein n=1 Tax=Mytilinidion resinicola TaxID=574789 RepID=A0A6A6Z9G2_9PEZI|nr:uncharacterized protein BDZ99DRAFT_565381 [Mytilinidion resinicola]KAF2817670.1 hypothetical protein BDZ99DRAFT_565381 [Mytilinidion resinicola]
MSESSKDQESPLAPHNVETRAPDGREYEFFVTTGQPHQPEGASRATIRRVVMRNFFNDKYANTTIPLSAINSSLTVQAGGNLKGRFRLPKPGQVTPPEKQPRSAPKRKPGKQDAVVTGPSTEAKQSKIRTVTKKQVPQTCGGAVIIPPIKAPPRNRYDPFDCLPIPGSSKIQLLFTLYKTNFRINSIAVNARNTWWPFISRDATMLHSTLASVALYNDLTTEGITFRIEALRHKNEAIKGINAKLNSQKEGISDEVVGAVATIASFENLYGAYDAAQLHITALKRMITARGGLQAFSHNDGLMRGLVWVDFHSSTVFRTPPAFPYHPPTPSTPEEALLPDALLAEAACSSPTSLLHLSTAGVDCFNVFYRLHRLGLATSSAWAARVAKLALANLLYEAEYALLAMPDRSPLFLGPDRARRAAGRWDPGDDAAADAASVVEALVAAGQIFLYAALREVPVRARVFEILLARLRATVERGGVSVVEVWEAERNVHTLLWVLVVGATVARHWGGTGWWVEGIGEVVGRMGLGRREEFEGVLKGVAWTDVFFGGVGEGLWEDVLRVREEERRRELGGDEDGDGGGGRDDEREASEEEDVLGYAEVVDLPIMSKDGGLFEDRFAVENPWSSLGTY